MFERLSRSWGLVKASASVLQQDKELLVFPLISSIAAVKESATLLKKTWGENVIGQGGIGFAFGLITFAIVTCGIALVVGAAATGSMVAIILAVVIAVVAVIAAALIHTALAGIYAAALYRYATEGTGTSGFDTNLLANAFSPKK